MRSIISFGVLYRWQIIFAMLFLVFTLEVLFTAWLSDDSFITFRVVDNFVNGYGLRWNVAERVEVYTHPLWMLLVSLTYFITSEIYYTVIFLSIFLSILTAYIFIKFTATNKINGAIGFAALLGSKAYGDYSTSGLENPLSHLLIVLFFAIFFNQDKVKYKYFWLSFIAALGLFNRIDLALIYFPVLLYLLFHNFSLKNVSLMILGSTPFLSWKLFSLTYYGFIAPNTAYAKLNTGIDKVSLFEQGGLYLLNSLLVDPILVTLTAMCMFVVLLRRKSDLHVIVLGIFLYLIYIVSIGGDFMTGRFLTVPFITAIIVLSQVRFSQKLQLTYISLVVLLSGYSVLAPFLSEKFVGENILSGFWFIADEREVYTNLTGLESNAYYDVLPKSGIGQLVETIKSDETKVKCLSNVGLYGFLVGPSVYFVDNLALTDPLLARLPMISVEEWRVGHYHRYIPDGYLESIDSGVVSFEDKQLEEYYRNLQIVTQGELLSVQRLSTIWKMNTGQLDYLINWDYYKAKEWHPIGQPYWYD